VDLIDRPSINERVQDAKKLFGFVVANTPEETFRLLEAPKIAQLDKATRLHFGATYAETFRHESLALDLLEYGVKDTSRFVGGVLAQHSDITFEQAITIATHERTIKSLAVVARQREVMSSVLLKSGTTFVLDADEASIALASQVLPNRTDGCLAVDVEGGDVRPWPLFERFGRWAGELTVRAYFHHADSNPAHARQDKSSLV
jgi:hypothetical protein